MQMLIKDEMWINEINNSKLSQQEYKIEITIK